jgi:hypothetical protein
MFIIHLLNTIILTSKTLFIVTVKHVSIIKNQVNVLQLDNLMGKGNKKKKRKTKNFLHSAVCRIRKVFKNNFIYQIKTLHI